MSVDKTPPALSMFGSSPSFPAMVLPDVEGFNSFLRAKQNNYFTERAEELRTAYSALTSLAADTEFVNKVESRYEPQVGKTYWIYEGTTGVFMSIIEPGEWTNRTRPEIFYGAFTLSGDGTWMREEAV